MPLATIFENLLAKQDLTKEETKTLTQALIGGEIEPAFTGAILIALHMKGVTALEIVGLVEEIQKHAKKVQPKTEVLLDVVGSGGDHQNTFNISTATAFVLVALGYKVAKHGNRAVTSKCGSADVIEALGLPLDFEEKMAAEAIDQAGFCFLFAPFYHPILKNLAPVRKALPVRTIFNFLGPLLNPAQANYALIGISDANYMDEYAKALPFLGLKGGYLVHGEDGLDEISTTSKTLIYPFGEARGEKFVFDPEEYGFKLYQMQDIQGGDAKTNARLIEEVLSGKSRPALLQAVVLNAGFMVHLLEQIPLEEAFNKVSELLASHQALEKLEELKRYFAQKLLVSKANMIGSGFSTL